MIDRKKLIFYIHDSQTLTVNYFCNFLNSETYSEEKNIKMERKVNYTEGNVILNIDVDTQSFVEASNYDVMRFFKGHFRNEDDYHKSFLNKIRYNDDLKKYFDMSKFVAEIEPMFSQVQPFTYEEAFKIENAAFRAMVFGSVNIGEMIQNLGAERIKTDGIQSTQKIFTKEGEFLGTKEITNVYEVYEVDGTKLGIENQKLYALKCWCTSTNNEHWLWIEDVYKNNPLEAVASTFRIHSDLIDKIKEIKRQGDVLLVELKEEFKNYEPTGEIVPLTAEQYFGLLTTQA